MLRPALFAGGAMILASCATHPTPASSAASTTTTTVASAASSPMGTTTATVGSGAPGPVTTAARAPSSGPPVPSALTKPAAMSGRCRSGAPLANVYHADRLEVRSACLTVTGTVAVIRSEDDGDLHFNLTLPAAEAHLLDAANYSDEDGQLVAEIVPADQPGCPPGQLPPLPPTAYRSASYSYGTCTGSDVATPPVGAQVSISGPYVLDSDHGWMEIHPVWSVTVLSPVAPTPGAHAFAFATARCEHPTLAVPGQRRRMVPGHRITVQ
jgi:hypothetical protein